MEVPLCGSSSVSDLFGISWDFWIPILGIHDEHEKSKDVCFWAICLIRSEDNSRNSSRTRIHLHFGQIDLLVSVPVSVIPWEPFVKI